MKKSLLSGFDAHVISTKTKFICYLQVFFGAKFLLLSSSTVNSTTREKERDRETVLVNKI